MRETRKEAERVKTASRIPISTTMQAISRSESILQPHQNRHMRRNAKPISEYRGRWRDARRRWRPRPTREQLDNPEWHPHRQQRSDIGGDARNRTNRDSRWHRHGHTTKRRRQRAGDVDIESCRRRSGISHRLPRDDGCRLRRIGWHVRRCRRVVWRRSGLVTATDRDPVVVAWLVGCILEGLVFAIQDMWRWKERKRIRRSMRPGYELTMHITQIVTGGVGLIAYNWAIPVLACIGLGLAVIAYRFPSKAPRDRTGSQRSDEE